MTPDWIQNFNTFRESSAQYSLFSGNNSQKIPASSLILDLTDQIINGDCLERLKEIPSDSIDFIFTDPPYNLGKKYSGYSDDLEIKEYFNWCDRWLAELARVLKPGRTLALLNIPIWSIRHFLFMNTLLQFQNWIAWDALSFPVRLIMPAHYTILAFSKGESRELPGLVGEAGQTNGLSAPLVFDSLKPLAEEYCLRSGCVKQRQMTQVDDRAPLTDLWWDVHRLKHNSRRVDHPTQLPPQLMYRLISIFTKPGELVLDCFNGSGTTTLAAHQLGRHYIGIEKSPTYFKIAQKRHEEITQGFDPFRKEERKLTAKNSRVRRLPKQKYEVSKKTLQLEVKRIAQELGRLPTREEVERLGKYPIKYYDDYFVSWGEVCAAARTTGMTEDRDIPGKNDDNTQTLDIKQLSFEFDQES
jgi:site-specific DNA-methyltransferase (adenine-specific)